MRFTADVTVLKANFHWKLSDFPGKRFSADLAQRGKRCSLMQLWQGSFLKSFQYNLTKLVVDECQNGAAYSYSHSASILHWKPLISNSLKRRILNDHYLSLEIFRFPKFLRVPASVRWMIKSCCFALVCVRVMVSVSDRILSLTIIRNNNGPRTIPWGTPPWRSMRDPFQPALVKFLENHFLL